MKSAKTSSRKRRDTTSRKKHQSFNALRLLVNDEGEWAAGRMPALDQPTDELNRAIINLLQEDGRLSFARIAEILDVSEGTVRNRVNRMIDAKVLRIIAVADPLALGYTGYAMLGMHFAPNVDPDAVAKRFVAHEEVTYVLLVAGHFDLLVEVICENQSHLRDFIFEHCYRQPDIASVEPMFSLQMYKNLLKWGQPAQALSE